MQCPPLERNLVHYKINHTQKAGLLHLPLNNKYNICMLFCTESLGYRKMVKTKTRWLGKRAVIY